MAEKEARRAEREARKEAKAEAAEAKAREKARAGAEEGEDSGEGEEEEEVEAQLEEKEEERGDGDANGSGLLALPAPAEPEITGELKLGSNVDPMIHINPVRFDQMGIGKQYETVGHLIAYSHTGREPDGLGPDRLSEKDLEDVKNYTLIGDSGRSSSGDVRFDAAMVLTSDVKTRLAALRGQKASVQFDGSRRSQPLQPIQYQTGGGFAIIDPRRQRPPTSEQLQVDPQLLDRGDDFKFVRVKPAAVELVFDKHWSYSAFEVQQRAVEPLPQWQPVASADLTTKSSSTSVHLTVKGLAPHSSYIFRVRATDGEAGKRVTHWADCPYGARTGEPPAAAPSKQRAGAKRKQRAEQNTNPARASTSNSPAPSPARGVASTSSAAPSPAKRSVKDMADKLAAELELPEGTKIPEVAKKACAALGVDRKGGFAYQIAACHDAMWNDGE